MDEQNIDFYTKEEVNELLSVSETADENEMQIDFYTKTEVDDLIAQHGGGTIVSKTITENGVYNASADNADGYSPVTVNVPSSVGYYGQMTAKTFADTSHFQFAEFSTADYSADTAAPAMFAAAAEVFAFDYVETPTTKDTYLTYGSAQAKAYDLSNGKTGVTITGAGDYFTLNASTPWNAKYIINSNACMLSMPRSTNGIYNEYTAFVFGKMDNDAKAAIWSSFYSSKYRQSYSWGMTPNGYSDVNPITGGTGYIGLYPSPINGIYNVVYGSPLDEGFYEVDGQIFYIAAGLAIIDA